MLPKWQNFAKSGRAGGEAHNVGDKKTEMGQFCVEKIY